ncbi:protein LURP-one-related 4 [Ricinus communis]|uniref:GTP binding protein, putative n=1 Tax=Ricinus communis TaxID=3988 RepID=B9RC91_RICCO|nr:protein LURP-one-related 4 [Ricinus communis]EEF51162.1 GTP binding protein, putative [Ricinus communis]|eukprot:XP_002509775.1 protein LURP-one-related 4 [Ricinus communis]
MAKVFPHRAAPSPAFDLMTFRRETFTVWMKSLVCHTNGCTVFDTNGEIVYRVENYDKKCSSEVYLMDLRGRVLVTIRRKRLLLFGSWYGYRWNVADINKEKPWFQVRKCCSICMGNLACQVTVGFDKYWIVKLGQRAAFRIVDFEGDAVAEVKQKQSSSGITLGDDVLTLIVEPHMDHSLVMAIITVYGLINRKL